MICKKNACQVISLWIEVLFIDAEVVELVDTLGSGSSGFTPVGVRVSPSAPTSYQALTENIRKGFFCFFREQGVRLRRAKNSPRIPGTEVMA